MIIYDKGSWQLDGGVSADLVIKHFEFVFRWLNEHDMLNEYGKDCLSDGIDKYISLTDEMLNAEGKLFLDRYYDLYISQISYGEAENAELLEEMYYKC